MKKAIALILVLVMVLSFTTIALAADSPTGSTVTGGTTGGTTGTVAKVEVKEASAEGKAALEAAVGEQLAGKLTEGQTTQVIATFSAAKAGAVEAIASQHLRLRRIKPYRRRQAAQRWGMLHNQAKVPNRPQHPLLQRRRTSASTLTLPSLQR